MNNSLNIITGNTVNNFLEENEKKVMDLIKKAYIAHYTGKTSLPQSCFLRFPNKEKNRIIALPGYIDCDKEVAGIKWISSFPDNIKDGIDRASAIVALNDINNGRTKAVIEGAQISSNRTAASAALAAVHLHKKNETKIGMIGTGLINFTILKYLITCFPDINCLYLYDLDPQRANSFKESVEKKYNGKIEVICCESFENVFKNAKLISFATTSAKPYIFDGSLFKSDMTILHISLRDLSEDILLNANNIVDDVDHVCRAETSIHLTYKKTGNRDFVNGVLAQILNGETLELDDNKSTIFSPFGLGMLDLILSEYVYEEAVKSGECFTINDFYINKKI